MTRITGAFFLAFNLVFNLVFIGFDYFLLKMSKYNDPHKRQPISLQIFTKSYAFKPTSEPNLNRKCSE